jgi:thiol-disulfide isomerase/thioredoxin
MRGGRSRLLVGSLLAAVAVIAVVAAVMARSSDDSPPADAVLTDPQGTDPSAADQTGVGQQPSPDNPAIGNNDIEGDPFPTEAVLTDADGNDVLSGSLLGQPLVVNFWFSTCAPCAKELPEFAEVHGERGEAVRFVGINPVDSTETMERFAGDRGVTYELLQDQLAELTDGIGAVAFPVTIFVTADGTIVEQTGVLDADGLRTRIDDLIDDSS